MATLTQTLGLTRKIFQDAYLLRAEGPEAQWRDLLNVEDTTEGFVIKKQIIGLGPAKQTNEGESVHFDDPKQLYQANFTPVTFTLGMRWSKQFGYTLQYKEILDKKDEFADSFLNTKNRAAANIYNLGFTSTTMGMNNESLFMVNHSMGGSVTGSNRPAVDLVLSPLAIEQGLTELRLQKDPNGNPWVIKGGVDLIVPPALEIPALRYVEATKLAMTNNNDPNILGRRVRVVVNDYLTSSTAWFLKARNAKGPFLLQQMPYELERLPRDVYLMDTLIASESYIPGWGEWHGLWGTTGAPA